MSIEVISEFYSDDKIDKAVVKKNEKDQFVVDFYHSNKYSFTILYPNKSLNYVEDAAENYVMGFFPNWFPKKGE